MPNASSQLKPDTLYGSFSEEILTKNISEATAPRIVGLLNPTLDFEFSLEILESSSLRVLGVQFV